MLPLPCLCAFSCPFLICSLLLCWPCGADQFLYLHILLSLCFQSLQPQLINAVERRQMNRRAEGSETRITACHESVSEKAELQKKQLKLRAELMSYPPQYLTKSQNNSAKNLLSNPHFQVQGGLSSFIPALGRLERKIQSPKSAWVIQSQNNEKDKINLISNDPP